MNHHSPYWYTELSKKRWARRYEELQKEKGLQKGDPAVHAASQLRREFVTELFKYPDNHDLGVEQDQNKPCKQECIIGDGIRGEMRDAVTRSKVASYVAHMLY